MTVLLILPYLFASLAFSPFESDSKSSHEDPFVSQVDAEVEELYKKQTATDNRSSKAILLVCALTSGTLLLVGLYAKIKPPKMVLDRRKSSIAGIYRLRRKIGLRKEVSRVATNVAGVALPFYAAIQLGGGKVAMVLLSAVSSGLTKWFAGRGLDSDREPIAARLKSRKFTVAVLTLGVLLDFTGVTDEVSKNTFLGYMALILSLFVLPFPFSSSSNGAPKESVATTPPRPWESVRGAFQTAPTTSSLIASPYDVNITILTAISLSMVAMVLTLLLGAYNLISRVGWMLSVLSMISAAGNVFVSQPLPLLRKRNLTVGFGCVLVFSPFNAQTNWLYRFSTVLLTLLLLGTTVYESPTSKVKKSGHSHDHSAHSHKKQSKRHSRLTAYLLTLCEPGSISYSVLIEKDSRRIAYFAM